MRLLPRLAKKEYGLVPRLVGSILIGGTIFLGLFPLLLVKVMPSLDRLLQIPSFYTGAVNLVIGGVLIAVGMFFAIWSIGDQLFIARGTPLPVMATQKLLISGPFKYCRNPMTFGTLCAYTGVAVAVGSWMSLFLVLLFGALLITYLKRIEEGELAERFGDTYLAYKAATPFIIPHLWRRRQR